MIVFVGAVGDATEAFCTTDGGRGFETIDKGVVFGTVTGDTFGTGTGAAWGTATDFALNKPLYASGCGGLMGFERKSNIPMLFAAYIFLGLSHGLGITHAAVDVRFDLGCNGVELVVGQAVVRGSEVLFGLGVVG